MKDFMIKIFATINFVVCVCAQIFGDGLNAAQAARYLNEARTSGDYHRMFELMKILDDADFWTLGAGFGPHTPQSLQLLCLSDICSVTNLDEIIFAGLESNEWAVAYHSARAGDIKTLRNLLCSDNSAMRYLGIYFAHQTKNLTNGELTAELRRIAYNDNYFQIVGKSDIGNGRRSSIIGRTFNAVEFPLRSCARKLLADEFVTAELTDADIDFWVKSMVEIWNGHPERRKSIRWTMMQFHPQGKEVASMRRLSKVKGFSNIITDWIGSRRDSLSKKTNKKLKEK